MSLEALLEPVPERVKEKCKVGRIVDDLAEPYKSALALKLDLSYANGGLADEELARLLKAAELPVGATIINRHRRGRCTCQASK